MSSFQCYLGWSLSIGYNLDICTQKYVHIVDKWSNSMSTTSSMIAFYQKNDKTICSLHLFGSMGSDNPKAHVHLRNENRNMLRYLSPSTFCLQYLLQESSFKAFMIFHPSYSSLWRLTQMDIFRKYNSQLKKGCQISNAVWDGACQLVII